MRWLLVSLVALQAELTYADTNFGTPFVNTVYTDADADAPDTTGAATIGDPATGTSAFANCNCDLTANQCDAGCCCDDDCVAELRVAGGAFNCPTTTSVSAARYGTTLCSENNVLVTANLPAAATRDSWGLQELNGFLCLVRDNAPSLGAFYDYGDALTVATAAEFQDDVQLADAAYGTYDELLTPTSDAPPTTYKAGEIIQADGCVSGAYCSRRRPFEIPSADDAGGCTSSQRVRYYGDNTTVSCLPATTTTLETACTSVYNVSTLLTDASRVMSTPSQPYVSASAPTIYHRSGNGTYTVAATASAVPDSSYASSTCTNAVVATTWIFSQGTTVGTLSAAVYLELADLTEVTAQVTTASFAPPGSDTPSRTLSGRPGYIRGLPVLVADTSGTSKVARSSGIALLPRTTAGVCVDNVTGTSLAYELSPTLFGEDQIESCSQQFTSVDALRTWCTGDADLSFLDVDLDGTTATWLGAFGDSHPESTLTADWVQLRVESPGSLTRTWSEETLQCSNVLSGVELTVVFAESGPVLQPHKRIVGAELKITKQTIEAAECGWQRYDPSTCPSTNVIVTSVARFVERDAAAADFTPPPPSVFPVINAEILYPFVQKQTGESV